MQGWFNVRLPDVDRCPDCRIMIDRGDIRTVDTPAGDDFVSAAFENIAVAEKGLQSGSIYASRDVVDNCDRTLARFVSYSTAQPRPADKVEIYKVDFLDPRTTDDSSLLHALFVAHPQSQEARDRVLELFLLEYLLENKELRDFDAFNKWARGKSYSTLPKQKLEELCNDSTYVMVKPGQTQISYTLTPDGLTTLEKARKEFVKARNECIHTVQLSITKQCGTSKATDQYDLPLIVEEYLCAIFSETRNDG